MYVECARTSMVWAFIKLVHISLTHGSTGFKNLQTSPYLWWAVLLREQVLLELCRCAILTNPIGHGLCADYQGAPWFFGLGWVAPSLNSGGAPWLTKDKGFVFVNCVLDDVLKLLRPFLLLFRSGTIFPIDSWLGRSYNVVPRDSCLMLTTTGAEMVDVHWRR